MLVRACVGPDEFVCVFSGKMKEQQSLWDPRGDGKVSKGEFRLHIKRLGLKPKDLQEVDDLFSTWDEDDSGSLDLSELRDALMKMYEDYKRRISERQSDRARARIAALRARVQAGKAAVQAWERAEKCKAELTELTELIESRIDVQLGRLITSRGINISEVIGQWPKSRSSSVRRELSKADVCCRLRSNTYMARGTCHQCLLQRLRIARISSI